MPVVMQRQVPRIQTVLKTMEVPPAQFVGRVMGGACDHADMPMPHVALRALSRLDQEKSDG